MKQACLFLLAVFIFLAANASAQTTPQQTPAVDPKAMRRCQSFSECTLIWGGCGDEAINKKYSNQYKTATACNESKQHDPKAVPTCTDGLCVAVTPDQQK